MSVYRIRHATAADAEQARELIRSAIISELGIPHNFDRAYANFLEDPSYYAVCEYEGELVGIREFYLTASLKYIDLEGNENEVKKVWCSGIVYIKPEHTRKHLRFLMNYLLLQDIVASKNPDPHIYALPGTEWGERNLIEHEFEKIGGENIPEIRPPNRTKPFPLYRGKAEVYFRLTEEELEQVKVQYAFSYPGKFKFRRGTKEDHAQVRVLIEKGLIEELGTASVAEELYRHFLEHPSEFGVCEYNEKIIGIKHFCNHGGFITFIDLKGKHKSVNSPWTTSVAFILKGYRSMHIFEGLNYVIVKDIAKSNPSHPFIYAVSPTEEGAQITIKMGYTKVGVESMPHLRPRNKTAPFPIYRIHFRVLLSNLMEKIKGIKVQHEFC